MSLVKSADSKIWGLLGSTGWIVALLAAHPAGGQDVSENGYPGYAIGMTAQEFIEEDSWPQSPASLWPLGSTDSRCVEGTSESMPKPGFSLLFRDGVLVREDFSVDPWTNHNGLGQGSTLHDILSVHPANALVTKSGDQSYVVVVEGPTGTGVAFHLTDDRVEWWSLGQNPYLTDLRCEDWSDPLHPTLALGVRPESALRRLRREELSGYSRAELRVVRNEIFARHGRPFSSPDLRQYFSEQRWYSADPLWLSSHQESRLSEVEKANVELIYAIEMERSEVDPFEQKNSFLGFYLHPNGVTVQCERAAVGATGMVNGRRYIRMDRAMLDRWVENGFSHPDADRVCVSGVTDLSDLFAQSRESLDLDLSDWDVSSATNMSGMFAWIYALDLDLSHWDVSNVMDMSRLFSLVRELNVLGLSEWDVSSVRNMSAMFEGSSPGEDISQWDVSSVEDMSGMFYDSALPDNLLDWDVSNVTDWYQIVRHTLPEQILYDWNLSLSQYLLLRSWGTLYTLLYPEDEIHEVLSESEPTDLEGLAITPGFEVEDNGVTVRCESASVGQVSAVKGELYLKVDRRGLDSWVRNGLAFGPIGRVCVSGITDLSRAFLLKTTFNGDLSDWDVSSATDMSSMFEWAESFNQDLAAWNVSRVTDMSRMFWYATSFNGDVSTWDVSSVTDMTGMFNMAVSFSGDHSGWNLAANPNQIYMYGGANETLQRKLLEWWGPCESEEHDCVGDAFIPVREDRGSRKPAR